MKTKHKAFIGTIITSISIIAIASGIMELKKQKNANLIAKKNEIELRKISGIYEKFFKRPLDVALSIGATIVLFPLILFIALLVKIKLGSPVIFTQYRPGMIDPKSGKEKIFKLYKFRTMTDEKDEFGNLLPDSVRLTKFGAWLRSTSLDELPELINIIKGDMSIIGPRPQLVKDMVFMTDGQRKRHTVRPGLSGLAQVSGRNSISWEDKLSLDIKYLNDITLKKDINIILKTLKNVFLKDGINEDGQATALDYGEQLLKEKKVNREEFNKKQEEANKLLKNQCEVNKADVLIINDNNLGFLGGERESQLIIINGASKKYRLAVIQPGLYEDSIPNVDFYWLTDSLRMKYLIKNPFAFIKYIFDVAKLINQISPKVIHSNSQVSFFMVSLLRRWKLVDRKIVFIHTDRGLYTKYNWFFKNLFQFSFKYLDVLVTTTEYNAKYWKKANDSKKIKLDYKIIPNTAGELYEKIDKSRFSNNDYLSIGFAGRMCDWKGWPLAEEICKESEKLVGELRFYMYVSCFDEEAEKKTKLLFERMNSCYGDRFIGRINVPFEEMEQFYYDTDIYILTSWPKSESFGRTIVEAMSRQNVILMTDAGGAVEVVNDSKMVCSSASDFAKRIEFFANNKEEMNKIKIRNLDRVRKKYTLKQNIDNYISLYDDSIEC